MRDLLRARAADIGSADPTRRCEPPGRPGRRAHEEAPVRHLMERVKELEQLVGHLEKRVLTLQRMSYARGTPELERRVFAQISHDAAAKRKRNRTVS